MLLLGVACKHNKGAFNLIKCGENITKEIRFTIQTRTTDFGNN